jgi:ribosome biogenesis GTPase A
MTNQHIQWYPGHMHKASKEIREVYTRVDVFIELLDGRAPFSSSNPMLAEIRGGKPCLTILTKTDLSDSQWNGVWQAHYEKQPNTTVLLADPRKSSSVRNIPGLCRKLYSQTGGGQPTITAMVTGIPNVGKSTLINGLAGRAIAKTGNEPAVTKHQQLIEIQQGFLLMDTPGLMWPKVENFNSGYRLAVTGAIKDTAISHNEVAMFALGFLKTAYSGNLLERYKIEYSDQGNDELLAEVGRRRGCLMKGGKVDFDRAAKIVLSDIRDGRLGRITWETPEMIEQESLQVEVARKEKAERDRARKENWKKGS